MKFACSFLAFIYDVPHVMVAPLPQSYGYTLHYLAERLLLFVNLSLLTFIANMFFGEHTGLLPSQTFTTEQITAPTCSAAVQPPPPLVRFAWAGFRQLREFSAVSCATLVGCTRVNQQPPSIALYPYLY